MKYRVGETVNVAPMFERLGYTCDSPELLQVTITEETQHIDVNYSFIEPTNIVVETPSLDSVHEINHPVTIFARVQPTETLDKEWHLEVISGCTVEGHKVTGTQVGKVEFELVVTEKPTVRKQYAFTVIDSSSSEAFSMDNSKEELQNELENRGISYKSNDTKKVLLEKLGV